ncbi:aromatase/cyclase [Streptomyces collinus]|uniref:Actinorhodin polyketide synthase bifunctional cyclase/dehydratase n=1 Tax=Streptomyces collinus (strain DSM 40733 / Tue 365) TaxID=1214242 RepID=S5VG08_STRC3|nr:aromatase/cyclase [Streptomyces collinus]AGS69487.1 actinorhodin polyketide synthase bifunctional cyclase/dehydratase [Streptomyces collinus Tu 365]UJA08128.1 actinorhodin polyketide synthase bifunctional cyclase/dehydratase [Streptomyces collinus]UJA17007.1 actinorhodin polyketide synthase bifunctional cyclase/dehydratase [Streptomyces collinus]
MSVTTPHRTLHSIAVAAPAEVVYGIVADVTRWPQYFAPNVHVEHLEKDEGSERIHIWALANGTVKNWVSRRTLDPAALTVTFRQEVSAPPVAAMGGTWVVSPVDGGSSLLELHHDFAAVDDDPAGVEWITAAVDRNSGAELGNIKEIAERYRELDELVFSFEDTVEMAAEGKDVFDFLDRADLWPERLPHVARLDLTEDEPGVQVMAMDTSARDGSTHTTESVRVVFGPDRIVYKQTTVPGLMTAHTGSWTIVPGTDGVRVTSRHTVTLKPSAVERILGTGKTVADAREYVHKALSTNSTNTLKLAKAHAEALRG